MSLSRDKLYEFLQEKALSDTAIKEETPLFSSSLIDSFALVDLILFIEQSCGVKIAPFDVNLDNFDSVAKILQFVESRANPSSTSS